MSSKNTKKIFGEEFFSQDYNNKLVDTGRVFYMKLICVMEIIDISTTVNVLQDTSAKTVKPLKIMDMMFYDMHGTELFSNKHWEYLRKKELCYFEDYSKWNKKMCRAVECNKYNSDQACFGTHLYSSNI
jgi:predicted AlkP superfamily phosphohydrolase/phosphomutase